MGADTKLVLGYIRVSTIQQESGWGREEQESRIVAHCREHGLGTPELIHESQSAESIVKRNELHSVLARAEGAMDAQIPAHVVFACLDRWARDLIDQESLTLRCFRSGVRLHSTLQSENDTLDPSYAGDPMRTAIRQFFGIINQLDRAIIQRRMDGGLVRKGADGGFTGGRVPFGYQSINRDLQIEEGAAEAVRRIFALHRGGLDQSTIAAVVAREFEALCGHWQKRQVSRVLSRSELYQRGLYRSRTGAAAVLRPELTIVHDEEDGAAPTAAQGVDWEKMGDSIRLTVLAALWGVDEELLKAHCAKAQVLVRWRHRAAYVTKENAQKLEAIINSQK